MKRTLKDETKREVAAAEKRKEEEIERRRKSWEEESKREVVAAEERKEVETRSARGRLKEKEEELAEKTAAMTNLMKSQKEKTQKCLDVQVRMSTSEDSCMSTCGGFMVRVINIM